MNFIPIKVLGGGQTSDYDRKLLGTLGVKKNHISNGFSGGNGAETEAIFKDQKRRNEVLQAVINEVNKSNTK